MMAEWDVFPDAEQVAVVILNAASFTPYTVECGTELQSGTTYPAIVATRVGGVPRERHRLDRPNVQLDVWADTKAAAHDVAQMARTHLHSAEGKVWGIGSGPVVPIAVVTGVEDSLGLSWQFDTISNKPRYVLGVYLTMHKP